MPWPDWNNPFVRLPVFGTSVPIASVEFGPRNWPVRGIHRLTVGARARIHAVGAAGDVENRRVGLRPLVRQEVAALQQAVVLRLRVHEAHAVVEGQLVVHLPVVLHVALDVVVLEACPRRISRPARTS